MNKIFPDSGYHGLETGDNPLKYPRGAKGLGTIELTNGKCKISTGLNPIEKYGRIRKT